MDIYNNFQEFMFSNKVTTAAAGFAIGAASNTYIQTFLNEIILPTLINITSVFENSIKKMSPQLYNFLYIFSKTIWITIVWFVSIFMAYFILEYILNRNIIGISTKLDHNEKANFEKKKKIAKQDSIMKPIAEQIKDRLLFFNE